MPDLLKKVKDFFLKVDTIPVERNNLIFSLDTVKAVNRGKPLFEKIIYDMEKDFNPSKLQISANGIDFLIKKEGSKPYVYDDGSGYWTAGVGHTFVENGKFLVSRKVEKPHKIVPISYFRFHYPKFVKMDNAFIIKVLKEDLIEYENSVNTYIKKKLNQNQFDALVSWAFNTGSNIANRQLVNLINSGAPDSSIDTIWNRYYISSDGVTLQGLITRRKEESQMYFTNPLFHYSVDYQSQSK